MEKISKSYGASAIELEWLGGMDIRVHFWTSDSFHNYGHNSGVCRYFFMLLFFTSQLHVGLQYKNLKVAPLCQVDPLCIYKVQKSSLK